MKLDTLAQRINEVAHLRGEFLLRSGKISNEYFDKYQFESRPDLLAAIAEEMTRLLPARTEVLGAMEMGGIPVATAISLKTGIPICFIRKEAKKYGTCKFAEGAKVFSKHVTIIEDVITTGGAVIDSVKALRQEGAIITDVCCVIDRSEGRHRLADLDLKLHAVFDIESLRNFAKLS